MVRITQVLPHSRAYKAGIREGDILISLNGHEITDVLDYRFYLAEETVTVSVLRDSQRLDMKIRKDMYDDIGLDFSTPLMDQKHRCENACIFCFIDQLPSGLRESLYFKDDDSRLSFLHGNYITLTNLKEKDIDRLIEMHISPINISVHTTNPELRVFMMKNRRSGEVLSYLDKLAHAGLRLRTQIVLCKHINDGAELDRTMRDLAQYFPALESCSIVTAGLTRYRDGLYPLEDFTPQEARDVVRQVTEFSDHCLETYGSRIFYASDEIYVKASLPIPPLEFWGEFTQLENGVGMIALFREEALSAIRTLREEDGPKCREVTIATGECAFSMIQEIAKALHEKCPGLMVHVESIHNVFFGDSVNVTGLITAQDLREQLKNKSLGEALYLSRSMLRAEGDLFLDGVSPKELSEQLQVPIFFVDNDGGCLVDALLGEGAER